MKTVTVMLVKNDRDLAKALERIHALWSAPAGTPERDELEVLATLVEAYENKNYSVPPPSPIDAVRHVMDQRKLKNRDLIPYFGSASRVSEFLNGKSNLTISAVRKLHTGLRIPLESLVGTEENAA